MRRRDRWHGFVLARSRDTNPARDTGQHFVPPVSQGGGSGRLAVVGVSSGARSPLLPEVPSVAEQGFAGFAMGDWIGLFAPAGMADLAILRVAEAARAAPLAPEVATRLPALGLDPAAEGPEPFARFPAEERAATGALIQAEGIRLDG